MAARWAGDFSANVFLYHVPEMLSQNSRSLGPPEDVQFLFGLPLHPEHGQIFTAEEKTLSLALMQYIANFVQSGNPNYPYTFSRKSSSATLPPWPRFLPHTNGDNYKEFSSALFNLKGLKKAECSFWSDYIETLEALTRKFAGSGPQEEDSPGTLAEEPGLQFSIFHTLVTQGKPNLEKGAYK
nr:PREDICTED: thyroglobulin-like [Latimeria chalumnae]|eukprot:XP_006005323.2 PREDICTED: thyroglobulin-like [Latimeria chalumnae]